MTSSSTWHVTNRSTRLGEPSSFLRLKTFSDLTYDAEVNVSANERHVWQHVTSSQSALALEPALNRKLSPLSTRHTSQQWLQRASVNARNERTNVKSRSLIPTEMVALNRYVKFFPNKDMHYIRTLLSQTRSICFNVPQTQFIQSYCIQLFQLIATRKK